MLEKKAIAYEKAVLIGVINQSQNEEKVQEYLDELEFLTYTAGGEVSKRFIQRVETPNPKTYIGSGKMEEVQQYVKANEIGSVIFDDELSPAQQNNIEKLLRCKILDRTSLILDIFAQRAQTSYARTQVELAQYEYLLPRLTGLGHTWNDNVGVLVCEDRVKQRLKPTVVLLGTESHYLRKNWSKLTAKWKPNVVIVVHWSALL